jgi:hypothetical protein
VVLLHTLTNGQYGLHRDELQTLDDARHLDWGFVAYLPFTRSSYGCGAEVVNSGCPEGSRSHSCDVAGSSGPKVLLEFQDPII